jgi:hypothetical protein
MPKGETPNPYTYETTDSEERLFLVSFPWDAGTRALEDATTTRNEGCDFTRLLLGVGPDGVPDSTPMAFDVAEGTNPLTTATMAEVGVTTIDDVLAQQITAGF